MLPDSPSLRVAMYQLTLTLLLALAPALAHAQALKLVLLGTGSPEPATDRFGQAPWLKREVSTSCSMPVVV